MARTTRTQLRQQRAAAAHTRRMRGSKFVGLALVFSVLFAGVALADTVAVGDGDEITDIGNDTFTINKEPDEEFSVKVYLWLKKNNPGTTVANSTTVSLGSGSVQGSCDSSMSGTATSFTTPADWSTKADGTLLGPVEATVSGTVGGTETHSCTFRYQAPSSAGISPRNVDLTFNFNIASNSQPQVAADQVSVTVNEGSQATMTGTWSDADADDNLTLSASVGTVTKAGTNAGGTWSWSYTPDDGPDDTQTVTITVEDNTGTANATNTATFSLVVNNVAPTATAALSSLNAFTGQQVNFSFSATDPSVADTLAGFEWRFVDGTLGSAYGPYALVEPVGENPATAFTPNATYSACGAYDAKAQARDKDGGESNDPTVTVNVWDGDFHGAIKPAMRNMVQAGRVVPVQIKVGCGSNDLGGLEPTIQLLRGVINSETGDTEWEEEVTESVSKADTGGIMRPVDGGYMYNLQVPKSASAGTQYTVRVRPWGSSGPSLATVIEIRR